MKDYVNYVNFCSKNDHREPSPTIRKTQKLLIIGKTDKIMNYILEKRTK